MMGMVESEGYTVRQLRSVESLLEIRHQKRTAFETILNQLQRRKVFFRQVALAATVTLGAFDGTHFTDVRQDSY